MDVRVRKPAGADGKRRQIVPRGVRTKTLTIDVQKIVVNEAGRGLLRIQSNTTVKECLDAWLKDWAAHNAPARTPQGYERPAPYI